jgi:photosystem II stability/assembly factor-like uncharacterized protein
VKKLASVLLSILICTLLALPAVAQKNNQDDESEEDKGPFQAKTFKGLKLREIGPGLVSGRISDIAVHPRQPKRYFVSVASGGVWKTDNAGTTWKPVFDKQGSYSVGCVTLDPGDPLVVWVGTGENNSQRSVGYGDGVYKSIDGGKSWNNVGLKQSEHIGDIVVDPRDSRVVYVAAQGPLWKEGGERGLYKTTDGGESWERILEIDEHTGVNEVVLDPRNPDVVFASSYQRRRRVWTLINGGPGSGLHKSTDGGKTWTELKSGLPKVEMGRIGLALSPADPDVLYAIVEARGEEGGVFRSTDSGASWEKRGDYISGSPQYYNELVADPHDVDRVYSMDTWMHVTEDGGKTWVKVPEKWKHVDNHALWIDPDDTDHLISGCDGGVYETWDRGEAWHFKPNLPITQFYKGTPDDDWPFYNVYGGTQDNATLGGPSRTTNVHGIVNSDWYVTVFGDGFKTRVEPGNPDIVYSQYQYGGLARYDRRSGELIDIQPQPAPDEEPLRFNWDSALIVSPHSSTRLYFAAQRIFRSDDRGDSWKAVSPDLTSGVDRNTLEVMGRVWSVDAVSKNASTSYYGNIVALTESPLAEGLIYAGTDDGLVQVTEDGGGAWREISAIEGVPEGTYVNRLEASLHDAGTVYGAFNNHKNGDFKPYLMKSTDRGATWTSITGDLPERGSVYAVVEDHVDPRLLFAGTEFGLFFSPDGGERWIRLKGGIPVIAVRDLEIQRRESDLVVATFGRGFFILDDYSALRGLSEATLEEEARLFPVKRAWMYVEDAPMALKGKAFQGEGFYSAENPPFGAVFTYHLAEEIRTLEEQRKEREKETEEEGGSLSYPSWDELRAEDREEDPTIVLTVSGTDGSVVRRIAGPVKAGFHRVAWNLRYPAPNPTRLKPREQSPWSDPPQGPLAAPGRYRVQLAKRVGGKLTALGDPVEFETVPLGLASLPAKDREALVAFQRKTARLQRAVLGAVRSAEEGRERLDHIKKALDDAPGAGVELMDRARELESSFRDLQVRLSGDRTISGRHEPTPPSISDRIGRIVWGQWNSTSAPTQTNRDAYRYASQQFEPVLRDLRRLIETDLRELEAAMEAAGAPWTPGRVPRWSPE